MNPETFAALPVSGEADMAWPIFDIDAAPRDGSRQLVWVPTLRESPGHWIFARWYVDGRGAEHMAPKRAKLTARHGGYWSAHFTGGKPLKRAPTLYMASLPDPEAP